MGYDAEPLTRADAANRQLESAEQINVVLAVGTLCSGGFVGADGGLDLAAVRGWLADRLAADDPHLRRLRQRVVDGAHPHWQTVAVKLDEHVRLAEAPAGFDGLADLCGRLMVTPLPAGRPLWELLLLPGSRHQPAGFVLRLHHSVADGAGSVRLFGRLLGDDADQPTPPPPSTSSTAPPRQRLRLSLTRIAALFSGRIGPTPLLGRISPQRSVAFARVDLAGLADGARRSGGTINDALLAAVARGVAVALVAQGDPVPTTLRASVPVALADRGASGNATGVMVVDLPCAEPDPLTRVALIANQTAAAKQQARSQGTFELTRSRWGTRLFWFLAHHQRFVAMFVSNVKGPSATLHLAGAPVRQVWPVTPIQGNIRLGVTALSYQGHLHCGIHGDLAGVSASAVADGVQADLDAIAAAASLDRRG